MVRSFALLPLVAILCLAGPVRAQSYPMTSYAPPEVRERAFETRPTQAVAQPWVQGEFLTWWMKDRALPPLVSTSTFQDSLGVLDRPDSRVLFGGLVDGDVRFGGRFSAGIDCSTIDSCCRTTSWGIEVIGFFLGEHTNSFTASSTGNPVLARPFFDTFANQPFSEQVANLQIGTIPPGPGARPGFARAFTGTISVDNPTRVWGGEVNLGYDLFRFLHVPDSRGRILVGFRHFGFEEDLRVREDLVLPAASDTNVVPPIVVLPETVISIVDQFRTRNYFYGGQLGLATQARWGAFSLDVTGKLAAGWMDQQVEIRGNALSMTRDVATGQFLAPVNSSGGLLAQPSNIGRYDRTRFCVVPEVTTRVGYDLRDNVRLIVGYDFLYVSSVVRPADVIDLGVDPRFRAGGTPPADATRPAFVFRASDLWIQGVLVGLDVRY